MKSGNLNFLEPSRPLQACNGTALLYSTKELPNRTNPCVAKLGRVVMVTGISEVQYMELPICCIT